MSAEVSVAEVESEVVEVEAVVWLEELAWVWVWRKEKNPWEQTHQTGEEARQVDHS